MQENDHTQSPSDFRFFASDLVRPARSGHALLGALRLMCNCTRCAPNAVADRRIPESLSSTLAGFAIRRRREKSLLGAIMVTTGAKEPSHTLPAEVDVPQAGKCRPKIAAPRGIGSTLRGGVIRVCHEGRFSASLIAHGFLGQSFRRYVLPLRLLLAPFRLVCMVYTFFPIPPQKFHPSIPILENVV